MAELLYRRVAPMLVGLIVAGGALEALLLGNYCVVPSSFVRSGETSTAETSIYGFALYLETGTEHTAMYRKAVWWYETALLGEWAAAVTVGIAVYMLLGSRRRPR
jgi:hypothetical protein